MPESTNEQVEIGVGKDMAERVFRFATPPNVKLMQETVSRLLERDFSFREISPARPEIIEGVESHDKSFMNIRTSHPSDWQAPPVVDGNKLKNGAYADKTALSVEAVKFACLSLRAGDELRP